MLFICFSFVFHLEFFCFTPSFVSVFPMLPAEGVFTWTLLFVHGRDFRTSAWNGSRQNVCMGIGLEIYIPP